MNHKSRLAWVSILMVAALFLLFLAANAGRFLVVDAPRPSDVIVVLAGETDRRPARALELLAQHYAPGVLLDVPAQARIYNFTQLELAEKYRKSLPQAEAIRICPIAGLSTRNESHDVKQCLAREPGSRVLIVTSDFHTRRALSIFRHEIRGKSFSVAAAYDDAQFGRRWWVHRQWAKTLIDEWLRLLWWSAIERWL
jgi:CheY-like chemotaxis protein